MLDIDGVYRHLAHLSQSAPFSSAPNPSVVAALYSPDGTLIADGVHHRSQSADHAEVVAIKKAGAKACGATLVVSLEPCNHIGSTGACVDAIIDAGIAQVIYAAKDPNPIAAGGAQRLRDAGVAIALHADPSLSDIHRAWVYRVRNNRPYFIWKVATTLDGRIAASDGTSQWISSEESRADAQIVRAQSDAILIGTGTALADNPTLRPKIEDAASPLRIVMGEKEIPSNFNLNNSQSETLFVKSRDVEDLLEAIKGREINQVLVEAGPTLGSALMREGLINELLIYQAPILVGAGKSWLDDIGVATLADAKHLTLIESAPLGPDHKFRYRVEAI